MPADALNTASRSRKETDMAKRTVGFIGLGLMGRGMAKNILDEGQRPPGHGAPEPRARR